MKKIQLGDSYRNICGIVVRNNREKVYEAYQNGYGENDTVHIFSVTKSIISLLFGIAIDRGSIRDVNERVLDFFPDYKVEKGEDTVQDVTIKDMLTMTAPYKSDTEDYPGYFMSKDWVKAALDLLGGTEQSGKFRYAPVIGPDILSGILVRATGYQVLDFADKFLFSPLGIRVDKNIIFQSEQEQLAFYNERKVKGWVAGPSGVNTAGWGLNLTAADMAKIGQLYLNQGIFENKQIVSEQWIRESTRIHSHSGELGLSYGYLWWILDGEDAVYAAVGDGGNVIYVNQKKNLVISIASLFVPDAGDSMELITNVLEPQFD